MSKIEYNSLLFEISERLDQQNVLGRLLFMCRDFLTPDSSRQDNIQDTLSLFKELEDRKCLGVDRLQVLKDLLKSIRQWSLFGKVKKFESTRTEYNGLIEQIILVLDELNDMERLIAICRMAIAEANESNIQDVRSLFKELENNECLGIDCLGLLKEILTKTEQGDLLRDVEGFEARRNREDEFESRKAQVTDFMSSVGNRLIGVLTVKTVFKVVAGGITVASTLEVLSRGSTFDQLVSAVNKCVLPAGTSLIQITEGCVCLTVQAENLASLEALWSLYKDGSLKARLQDFFVNDEVREELSGGEELEVIVTIEEEEYQKALNELSSEIEESPDSCVEAKRMRIHRRNSDSNLYCKTMVSEGSGQTPVITERRPINQSRYLDQERFAFVQNYLEKAEDAQSMTTETSDSGIPGTHGAPSEFGLEDTSESSYKRRLKDLPENVTKELKWQLQSDPVAEKWFYESFGLAPPKEGRDPQVLEDLEILFPETPLKLLKDVFEALQLCDLVDLLEKEKPRTLRPSLPLRDIRKKPNYGNRPTRFYSKAAVLTIGTGTLGQVQSYTQRIGSFFKEFNSRSKVTTISMKTFSQVCTVLREWREIKENFERGDAGWIETDLKRDLQWFSKGVLKVEEAEELKIKEELERYVEMRKLKKKDRKLAFEKRINQTMEELQTQSEKFKMSLGQWITRKDEESATLFVVLVDVDTNAIPHNAYRMILTRLKERLELIPDEPKLVVFPKPSIQFNEVIPEALVVQFPTNRKGFQETMLEVFSKRWQTLDLVSMMHEVQRTFPLKTVQSFHYKRPISSIRSDSSRTTIIDDRLSSLPRLQKTEENSKT